MSSNVEPSWCQLANTAAGCEQIATCAPDGSDEPYLCDHCEVETRGQGGEEIAAGAVS